MGNKGSKPGGVGGKSARPPVKSDNRGFKFGNNNAAGRDAGKSAPAAPSSNAAYPPAAPASQNAPAAASSNDNGGESDGEDDSGPAEQVSIQEIGGADRPQTKVTIEDFDLLKVLGKGSFGKVMMVRKKDTKKIYAMKTLRKAALIKRNQMVKCIRY
uniref:non-specific serine/threonine protein kinase n=1 Tax=Globisporangium ultimum (strain ATCC 200006 / CBS 805.95 / DAOM BR144) TaxID=431595 RepID=K3W9X3_GLOUD